jgi:hypothetical protein
MLKQTGASVVIRNPDDRKVLSLLYLRATLTSFGPFGLMLSVFAVRRAGGGLHSVDGCCCL